MNKINLYVIAILFGAISFVSCEKNDDIPVSKIPATIQAFIADKYPNARIVEAETDRGMTDVDIIDGVIPKDVLFDSTGAWVSTSWDLSPASLPAVITDSLKKSAYSTHLLDDADYYETPAGDYYLLELEQGKKDVYIKMDLTGKIF